MRKGFPVKSQLIKWTQTQKNSSVESENWYINVCNIFLFSLQLNCCLRITLIIKPIGQKYLSSLSLFCADYTKLRFARYIVLRKIINNSHW